MRWVRKLSELELECFARVLDRRCAGSWICTTIARDMRPSPSLPLGCQRCGTSQTASNSQPGEVLVDRRSRHDARHRHSPRPKHRRRTLSYSPESIPLRLQEWQD